MMFRRSMFKTPLAGWRFDVVGKTREWSVVWRNEEYERWDEVWPGRKFDKMADAENRAVECQMTPMYPPGYRAEYLDGAWKLIDRMYVAGDGVAFCMTCLAIHYGRGVSRSRGMGECFGWHNCYHYVGGGESEEYHIELIGGCPRFENLNQMFVGYGENHALVRRGSKG